MEKEMICIVCPVGCHISVNTETYEVKGNACPRGAVYGKEELTAPKRVVTSTVKIKNALDKRCPVKTEKSIPKELNFKLMILQHYFSPKASLILEIIRIPMSLDASTD